MAKRGKISIATVGGVLMTLAHLWGKWQLYDNDTDRPHRGSLMAYHMTGYASATTAAKIGVPAGFSSDEVMDTWLPTVGGALISKYVGGPKGLNVNAQLKGIPLFKL